MYIIFLGNGDIVSLIVLLLQHMELFQSVVSTHQDQLLTVQQLTQDESLTNLIRCTKKLALNVLLILPSYKKKLLACKSQCKMFTYKWVWFKLKRGIENRKDAVNSKFHVSTCRIGYACILIHVSYGTGYYYL